MTECFIISASFGSLPAENRLYMSKKCCFL